MTNASNDQFSWQWDILSTPRKEPQTFVHTVELSQTTDLVLWSCINYATITLKAYTILVIQMSCLETKVAIFHKTIETVYFDCISAISSEKSPNDL